MRKLTRLIMTVRRGSIKRRSSYRLCISHHCRLDAKTASHIRLVALVEYGRLMNYATQNLSAAQLRDLANRLYGMSRIRYLNLTAPGYGDLETTLVLSLV